jgi:CRP-like cAMP-binding protein
VPLCNEFTPIYNWAFGAFSDKSALLKSFSGCFQCLLYSAGSEIFTQDSNGQEAYLISKGIVNISQTNPCSNETLNLATLSRGDMCGELSLIDSHPRSATATAVSNTELIVLDREAFWQKANEDPSYLKSLLKLLTNRLRDIDQRAFVYAHGNVNTRLKFFLNKVIERSVQSSKHPNRSTSRITIEEFSSMASAPYDVTKEFLNDLQASKRLKIGSRDFTFFDQN